MWKKIGRIVVLILFSNLAIGAEAPTTSDVYLSDSLFKKNEFDAAYQRYHHLFFDSATYTPAMLLKMAYIQEQQENFASELFYLCTFYRHHPSKRVLNKIEEIAEEYDLSGYSYSDLEYFISLYKQYYEHILLFLILCSITFCIYLIVKKYKGNNLGYRPAVFLIFLAVLYFFSNYSVIPPRAIINKNNCLLMPNPSAASDGALLVGKGHRITLLGKEDIWYRINWEGQPCYIREDNIFIIPESQPYLF